MAPINIKLAGNVSVPALRAMVSCLSSIGWRSISSRRVPNSGSSSRNNTPRCASEISPGPGTLPPPTSPAKLMVWCGARKGRWRMRGVSAGSWPATL